MRLITDTVRLLPGARAALEHDLHLRLPHPRGRLHGGPGGGASPSPTASPTSRPPGRPGSEVDDFAPQLSFFFNAHNNLLEEVAKFRAARRLWARIMRERFGARDPRSRMLRFHAQTAGSTLTAQQPENNIVRVAVQALAAVLGRLPVAAHQLDGRGARRCPPRRPCASRSAPSRCSPTSPAWPTPWTRSAAPTPSSGSRARSRRRPRPTSPRSTASAAPSAPSPSCSARSRRRPTATSRRSSRKARVVVGVNEFVMDEPPPANLFQVRSRRRRRRSPSASTGFAQRATPAAAERALEAVDRAARGRDNLLPPILDAVRAQVTLGEICRHAAGGLRCPPAVGGLLGSCPLAARGRSREALAAGHRRCSLAYRPVRRARRIRSARPSAS